MFARGGLGPQAISEEKLLKEKQPERDIHFTRRALELAKRGVGLVSPNPLVGCVIVSPQGEVLGEATYIYDEITHAEQAALEQAGEAAKGSSET